MRVKMIWMKNNYLYRNSGYTHKKSALKPSLISVPKEMEPTKHWYFIIAV
jgi:hypothetical protein